jgi:hypothetical protein
MGLLTGGSLETLPWVVSSSVISWLIISLDEKRGPAFRGRKQLRLTFTSQNAQLHEIRCWELADLCCNEIGVVGMRLPPGDPGIGLKNPVNQPIKMGKLSCSMREEAVRWLGDKARRVPTFTLLGVFLSTAPWAPSLARDAASFLHGTTPSPSSLVDPLILIQLSPSMSSAAFISMHRIG